MDVVQPASLLGVYRVRYCWLECGSFADSCRSYMARGLHIVLRWFVDQRTGGCGHGKAWRSLSHWLPRIMSVGHGLLWIHVLCLYPSDCWCHMVWDSVILRCQPHVNLPEVHLRT